jgi:hypothetical protein
VKNRCSNWFHWKLHFSLKPETFAFNQTPTLIWIHCKSSSNFDLFNLKFICRHLWNICRTRQSCCSSFSPHTRISSTIHSTPGRSENISFTVLQNTSGAELIPNGSLQYRYRLSINQLVPLRKILIEPLNESIIIYRQLMKLSRDYRKRVYFHDLTRFTDSGISNLIMTVLKIFRRGTNWLIEKSRSCTIVNWVVWFVNDSVTSSCTIILRIRTWFLDGKPQLLLIKETIINYLFAVPFLYWLSLMVYAPTLSLI